MDQPQIELNGKPHRLILSLRAVRLLDQEYHKSLEDVVAYMLPSKKGPKSMAENHEFACMLLFCLTQGSEAAPTREEIELLPVATVSSFVPAIIQAVFRAKVSQGEFRTAAPAPSAGGPERRSIGEKSSSRPSITSGSSRRKSGTSSRKNTR